MIINKERNRSRKVLGIIPARLESGRLPRKLLLPLGGKTLLERVFERIKNLSLFSEIYIATDSEEIFLEAEKFGAKVLITTKKPRSGTERIIETLPKLPLTREDIIINVQGDEPFVEEKALADLLELMKNPFTEIATLATPIKNDKEFENPSVVKVVINKKNEALYFSRSGIPFPRRNVGAAYKHGGIYAYKVSALQRIATYEHSELEEREGLEQLKWLDYGERIRIAVGEYNFFGIDTREDYIQAKRFFENS